MNKLEKSDPFLVIIGPSGTGKSSIVQGLRDANLVHITPSWTTRPKRQDELDDETPEHVFVDETTFSTKNSEGFFVEALKLFSTPYWYGLPEIEQDEGKISVVMLRAGLIPLLEKHYDNFTVYQIEASAELMQANMRDDGRKENAETAIEQGRMYAKRVFYNDELNETIEAMKSALVHDFNV